MTCMICGDASRESTCRGCLEVGWLVARYPIGTFVAVVDGTFRPGTRWGGAGLVLVNGDPYDGEHVAFCACKFKVQNSTEAEYEGITRAARWAFGAVVYSDCAGAIGWAHRRRPDIDVRWLEPVPGRGHGINHSFAHRLATEGRRAWAAHA